MELTIKDFLSLNTKEGEKIRGDINNKIMESKKQMDEG